MFTLLVGIVLISLPLNYSFQEMISDNHISYTLSKINRRYSSKIKTLISAVDVELEGENELIREE